MPVSQVVVTTPVPEIIFTDSSMGAVVDAVKSSSGTIYYVTVDNTLNTLTPAYVKLFYALAGSVVLGTTVSNEIFFVAPGAKETRKFLTGTVLGKAFPTALSAACVLGSASSNVTPPINPVTVVISYT
jgi:hypothetical protein